MYKNFYTKNGEKVYNPRKYNKAGGDLYAKKDINEKTDIYVLDLEHGKKYFGKSSDIDRRMEQHFSGNGAKVTKKFKPKDGKIIDSCSGFFSDDLEQYHTEEGIKKYGYENVRGGKYTNSKTLKKNYNKNSNVKYNSYVFDDSFCERFD